jgi:phosphoribosylglycinamide formyltransferase-1
LKKLAIFASGNGSNAENIYQYFKGRNDIEISLILTNNKKAFVIDRAYRLGIPCLVFNRDLFFKTDNITEILVHENIDWIILSGFLWLVPSSLLKAFPGRIINIHPALLPKYGGKGMYGHKVHEAVKQAGETVTGITIHYLNDRYDEGEIIIQYTCEIDPTDNPEKIAEKVHRLEYQYYPKVIDDLIRER